MKPSDTTRLPTSTKASGYDSWQTADINESEWYDSWQTVDINESERYD